MTRRPRTSPNVTRVCPALRIELIVEAKAGPGAARDELIMAFAPLVATVARLYRRAGTVDTVELRQEGVVGLLRALERFDPTQGTPFWAYATWWVRQAMQQLVAELGRPVVLSDRAARHLARVKHCRREHVQTNGREPTRFELANDTGLSRHQIDDLMAAERPPRALHEPLSAESGAGTVGDLIIDPSAEEAFESVGRRIARADLRLLLDVLNDRERVIVGARFGLTGPERTYRELSLALGLSAERVRQIEQRALDKLRAGALARTAAPRADASSA